MKGEGREWENEKFGLGPPNCHVQGVVIGFCAVVEEQLDIGERAVTGGDAERGVVISIRYIWIGTVGKEKIEQDVIVLCNRSACVRS